MKKVIASILAVSLLAGCADNRHLTLVKGSHPTEIKTYGLIDRDSVKLECVNYDLAWGNIIWSVILVETVIAPIYMLGFSLYEPVSVDKKCLAELVL